MLKKALAITLIASSIGAADVFYWRWKSLDIIPVKPPEPETPIDPNVAGSVAPSTPALSGNMISTEKAIELFNRMMTAGDVRFVDARNEEDFLKGRIPSAVSLPPTKFSSVVPPEVDQLQRDATIVIYCGGGECDASKLTALRLNELGFNTTLIFHDGFPAWQKAGQPIEK